MSAGEFVGKMLQGMGPGLLSGLGNALQPDTTGHQDADGVTHHEAPDPNKPGTAKPNSFKNGGVVQKTGMALVHKGEKVIPTDDHDADDAPKGKSMHNVSLHRALAHLHEGGLHGALGIPKDKTIPQDRIEKAKNSKNPHVAHMANFAHTLEGFKHGGKK
jgi:hypothetical protein